MPSIRANAEESDIPAPDIQAPISYRPDLKGADLRNVDARSAVMDEGLFINASFKGANFSRASFAGATFNNCTFESAMMDGVEVTKKHIAIYGLRHLIMITPTHMFIGCMQYPHAEWRTMTDETIRQFDEGAAEVWNVWREALLAACDTLAKGITR